MLGPVHAHRPNKDLSSAATGRQLAAFVTVVETADVFTRLSSDLWKEVVVFSGKCSHALTSLSVSTGLWVQLSKQASFLSLFFFLLLFESALCIPYYGGEDMAEMRWMTQELYMVKINESIVVASLRNIWENKVTPGWSSSGTLTRTCVKY